VLQTARTIGGVSFNGSANINLPGVNTAGNQNTSGNAATATTAGTITSQANSATITATSANTGNQIVLRDGSGNFSAGTITAALNGNASTSSSTSGNAASATVLQTARTIGGVSFNGSANIDLPGVNTAGNQNTSGNAATASNASLLNSISAVNLYNNMGNTHSTYTSFDVTTPSYGFGYRFVQGNANGPGTGATQYYSWYIGLGSDYPATGAGSYGAMFAVDRNVTLPYLSVRYNESNSFGAWRKVAAGYADTAGNAATATALQTARNIGGVSFNGTANIDLPGVNTAGNQNTSGSAGSVDFANLTNKGSGTGTYTTSGDYRAPIFYDSDNTAYYVNPASTSNLYALTVNQTINGTVNYVAWQGRIPAETGRSAYYPGIYSFSTFTTGGGGNPPTTYAEVLAWGGGGNGAIQIAGDWISTTNTPLFVRSLRDCCQDWSSWTAIATSGVSFTNNIDLRAPIFYDSNDTGYYVDPNGTSRIRKTNLIASGSGWDDCLNLYSSDQTNRWNLLVDDGASDSLRFAYNNAERLQLTTGGAVTAIGDFRAPIFYDSNDTTYYIDPASFTNVYGGIQSSGAHGNSTIDNRLLAGNNGAGTGVVQLRMWCSEPNVTWDWAGFGYNVLNDGGSPGGFGRPNTSFGQAYMRMSPDGDWFFYNTTTAASRSTTMQLTAGGQVIAFGSSRAPIFYDTDNTAYYVDPASTSVLNNIQIVTLGVGTAASGTTGEIRATNNVTAFYSSDIKFKENVRDIPDAVETVEAIGGKLFDWKDEYIEEHGGEDGYFIQKEDFGVIAQDVLKVFPIAVRTRPDGSLAVDYEKLSSLALAAVAELSTRVKSLEART
jgi:hypothetical protein